VACTSAMSQQLEAHLAERGEGQYSREMASSAGLEKPAGRVGSFTRQKLLLEFLEGKKIGF